MFESLKSQETEGGEYISMHLFLRPLGCSTLLNLQLLFFSVKLKILLGSMMDWSPTPYVLLERFEMFGNVYPVKLSVSTFHTLNALMVKEML